MCGSLKFGEEEVRVKTEFDPEGKLLIRDSPTSTNGRTPSLPVYWEGWAWNEKMHSFVDNKGNQKPGWLTSGHWKRAEVLATEFNEKFRWYKVPPHQTVKAIVLELNDKVIMKLLTREARGKEILVTGKRTDTKKKIEGARFVMAGPQRAFLKRELRVERETSHTGLSGMNL